MVSKIRAMNINSKKIGFKAIGRSCGVMDKALDFKSQALKVRAPVRETYNFFSLILFFRKPPYFHMPLFLKNL